MAEKKEVSRKDETGEKSGDGKRGKKHGQSQRMNRKSEKGVRGNSLRTMRRQNLEINSPAVAGKREGRKKKEQRRQKDGGLGGRGKPKHTTQNRSIIASSWVSRKERREHHFGADRETWYHLAAGRQKARKGIPNGSGPGKFGREPRTKRRDNKGTALAVRAKSDKNTGVPEKNLAFLQGKVKKKTDQNKLKGRLQVDVVTSAPLRENQPQVK